MRQMKTASRGTSKQEHMGRRPRFCPPLLSNTEFSLARLSDIAARHQEELESVAEVDLVSEVEVEEVSANVSRPFASSSCARVGSPLSRKRKSPRMVVSPRMGIFRSPLSRMMLSPRMHQWVRSPSSSQGASSSSRGGLAEIDLNMSIYNDIDLDADAEEQVNLTIGLDHDQHAYDNEEVPDHDQENARRKEVPDDIRKAIFEFLLTKSNNGNLKVHHTREASVAFSVHIRTVQRIWKDGKYCLDQGIEVNVSSKKSKRGRKKKEVDISKLRELPLSSRATLDDVAKELGINKTKLHKMKREGVIECVSNSLKPFLTEKNKKEYLKWCISMLDPRSVPHDPVFKGLFDFVIIDEKWFNITRKTERYYKAPDEEQPTRTCMNKNFIPKIMFLCALARPRFDSQGNYTFDGKIGCFPFVTYEAAKRTSKNRRAGTLEMKPMDSIKKGVIREFLIDKVLPAIRAKWP